MGISSNSSGFKAGDIKKTGRATLEAGWLWCDGSQVSRVDYAALFDEIGTYYGAGDGVNTFNLPDMRGRVAVGKDNMGGVAANRVTSGGSGINGATLGAVGGGETVTLTQAQMPSHEHTGGHTHTGGNSSGSGTFTNPSPISGSTAAAGSGSAHSNMPPALIINYIIKT